MRKNANTVYRSTYTTEVEYITGKSKKKYKEVFDGTVSIRTATKFLREKGVKDAQVLKCTIRCHRLAMPVSEFKKMAKELEVECVKVESVANSEE